MEIYDVTSRISVNGSLNRGLEIMEYLNNYDVTDYVILDDEISDIENISELSTHIVKVDSNYGLSLDNVDDSLIVLNSKKIKRIYS